MNDRTRLDQALVERGLCESREKARRAVLAGQVRLRGQKAHKASELASREDAVELIAGERFVSRGGLKLEHALKHFELTVSGSVAIDIGASTGGFTDCLLQMGAAHVFAVDVGSGQLAWKLRQDPRVTVMEGVNARHLLIEHFPRDLVPVDLVVIDCSFISLRHLLPPAVALLQPYGKVVALIKPQFEAGKSEADRGAGVIRDAAIHARVLSELETFVGTLRKVQWRACTESPIRGPAGNREFLALLEKVG